MLQLYLSLRLGVSNGRGIGWGLFMYFGYFTVLTNILAALTVSAPLVARRSRLGQYFARPGVITAVTTAIAMVGIVYSLILRQIWDPQGLQLIADRALHDVMPILMLIYWWFTVPRGSVCWRDVPRWLVYPIAYLVYVLIRGAIGGVYPYPFIEVNQLGYGQTLMNAVVILLGYVCIALTLVAVSRLKKGRV